MQYTLKIIYTYIDIIIYIYINIDIHISCLFCKHFCKTFLKRTYISSINIFPLNSAFVPYATTHQLHRLFDAISFCLKKKYCSCSLMFHIKLLIGFGMRGYYIN